MPPKRARAEVVKEKKGKEEEEKQPPEVACPPTEERKARAEEKQREVLANKRANLKGKAVDESNEESPVSPVKKKGKEAEEEEEEPLGKFDPMRILAQAGSRILVDTTTPDFIPLELDEDSIQLLEDDSLNLSSQLSPGLQLGNLSINRLSDSDSPGTGRAVSALHEAGQGAKKGANDGNYAGGLEGILGCAVTFMKKKGVRRNRKKGPDSLNAPYKRGKTVIGSTLFTNVLSKAEDLTLLERTYSAAELVLLSSPIYPLEKVHANALVAIHKTRLANERAGVQEGMTINQCLAWLARAGRCPVSSLIPQGEYYHDAEDYLRLRLSVPSLPKLSTACETEGGKFDEEGWTTYQVVRCMQMMAIADLSPLVVDDKCILLFAIGVLYIDDAATEEIRTAAHSLVNNVFSSCSDPTLLLEPLFNLTPLIVRRPDEAAKWILMFRACGSAPPQLLLCLGASLFVFICERAECTPDAFTHPSSAATFAAYINVLSDTMIDVFAVYNMMSHRRYHRSLISVLNQILTPSALKDCGEQSKQRLLRAIQAVRNRLNPDLPDDAIVITELRTMTRRVEMARPGRGGRRNTEEVVRLYEERARIKEEKEAELREEKREKEDRKKQRDVRELSAARNLMEDEEEEEEERRERERMEEVEEEDDDDDEEEEENEGSDAEMASTDRERSGSGREEGGVPIAFSDIDSMDETSPVRDLPDTVPETMDGS